MSICAHQAGIVANFTGYQHAAIMRKLHLAAPVKIDPCRLCLRDHPRVESLPPQTYSKTRITSRAKACAGRELGRCNVGLSHLSLPVPFMIHKSNTLKYRAIVGSQLHAELCQVSQGIRHQAFTASLVDRGLSGVGDGH
jgi:hypothetical protein